MTMHPILAALRKHKAGVVLIALQIALTLAIVCNAVFIIGQRIERVNRLTGLDESNLLLVSQQWVGAPSGDDAGSVEKLDSLQLTDLAALRALPGVESVAPINSLPLLNSSWNGAIDHKPGDTNQGSFHGTRTTYYFSDDQALSTLGLRLVAGRNFTVADVEHRGFRDNGEPSLVILTKALGDKLFPKGDALGKVIYLNGATTPTTIIGLVERMQVPGTGSWTNEFVWNSTLVPTRLDANFSRYAIRAKPGQLDTVMRAVAPALYKVNPLRVLDDDSVRSFVQIRDKAYQADRGMAILMGVVALILLCVTAAGIVGLTSFWVGQRRKQIGVRRALGARQRDILAYFLTENFLISVSGTVLGIVLGFAFNLWTVTRFAMDRMSLAYVGAGVLVLVLLGQAATLAPALRASRVSPVEATRSV